MAGRGRKGRDRGRERVGRASSPECVYEEKGKRGERGRGEKRCDEREENVVPAVAGEGLPH